MLVISHELLAFYTMQVSAYLSSRRQWAIWNFRRPFLFQAVDVMMGNLEQSLQNVYLLKLEIQLGISFSTSRTSPCKVSSGEQKDLSSVSNHKWLKPGCEIS